MSGGATPLRVGFVALTDAAPLVLGVEDGLFRARGLQVQLVRMASWPAVRDGLLDGDLDAAHCLASLPLSVAAGITGRPEERLPLLMVLNTGGQAITLARRMPAAPHAHAEDGLRALAEAADLRPLTFAVTYPGGTHDVWLRYWLAAAGVAISERHVIPIPPSQMVANLVAGTVDGFSAGEPWNAVAARRGIGFTAVRSDQIAPGLPEKALVAAPGALVERTDALVALVRGTLAACRALDDPAVRRRAAAVLAHRSHLALGAPLIEERLLGRYRRGAGLPDEVPGPGIVRFHDGGAVNRPRRDHALWFLAQFARLGLAAPAADPHALVTDLIRDDLYRAAAEREGVDVPEDDMAPIRSPLDGRVVDPQRIAPAGARAVAA